MNHDERDELWTLLGKARQPKPSAFFAAKVLRAVRAENSQAQAQPGFLAWLTGRWFLPAAGAAAAVLAFCALRPADLTAPAADPLEEIATAVAATPEIAPSFDTLLAAEDNSIWLAGDPSSLY